MRKLIAWGIIGLFVICILSLLGLVIVKALNADIPLSAWVGGIGLMVVIMALMSLIILALRWAVKQIGK